MVGGRVLGFCFGEWAGGGEVHAVSMLLKIYALSILAYPGTLMVLLGARLTLGF